MISIITEPDFVWCKNNAINNRDWIISDNKSMYWTRTTEFGTLMTKYTKYDKAVDEKKRNTLWWYSVLKEMKKIKVTFYWFAGTEKYIPEGYQNIDYHVMTNKIGKIRINIMTPLKISRILIIYLVYLAGLRTS